MNKKNLIILALLMFSMVSVFAGGNQEQQQYMPGPYGQWQGSFSEELLTLKGSLVLEENSFPKINSNGELYSLMYPHALGFSLDLKSGDSLTVEGFEVPGPRWSAEGKEKFIMVSKAIIDGKEYIIPNGPMMGRGYGMGGGYCFNNSPRSFGPMRGGRAYPGRRW